MGDQWIPFLSYFVWRLTFENIILIKTPQFRILNKLLNMQPKIL